MEDLQKDIEIWLSGYPQNYPLYSETNKKVLGKFKAEWNVEAAYEFVV